MIQIIVFRFNPLKAELNPICHLLALLGGATIVVVSRLRVKGLCVLGGEYLRFGGTYTSIFASALKMEAVCVSKTLGPN